MGIAENKAAVIAAYEAFGRGDIGAILAVNTPDTIWQIHSASRAAAGTAPLRAPV